MKTMHLTQGIPRRSQSQLNDDGRPRRLLLSPAAWLRWQYLCHVGPTEVAGFGLSAAADPLYLDDVLLVRQRATSMTVAFDDTAVADLFDAMVDAGIPPGRFARVWLHTHPGASVVPSGTDEETFANVFGKCDWAVMAILGRTGRTSARLRFSAGPGGSIDLPTAVDWAAWPSFALDPNRPLSDRIAEWQREYETVVEPALPLPTRSAFYDSTFADLLDPPPLGSDPQSFDPFLTGGLHEFD
jgi:proteasome lid subunit RPN8/RPN11